MPVREGKISGVLVSTTSAAPPSKVHMAIGSSPPIGMGVGVTEGVDVGVEEGEGVKDGVVEALGVMQLKSRITLLLRSET